MYQTHHISFKQPKQIFTIQSSTKIYNLNLFKMSRVFAIAVALSAVLFVAFAYPQEPAEPETTESSGGGSTTANPCKQFEEQCANGTSQGTNQFAPVQGGIGQIPGVGDAIKNQTMPTNMQCEALKQACGQQGGAAGGVPAMPAGVPGMGNGTNPIAAAEIPGVGGMNNLTAGGIPTGMPALPIPGMPGGRK